MKTTKKKVLVLSIVGILASLAWMILSPLQVRAFADTKTGRVVKIYDLDAEPFSFLYAAMPGQGGQSSVERGYIVLETKYGRRLDKKSIEHFDLLDSAPIWMGERVLVGGVSLNSR